MVRILGVLGVVVLAGCGSDASSAEASTTGDASTSSSSTTTTSESSSGTTEASTESSSADSSSTGDPDGVVVLADELATPYAIALDDEYVYWTNQGSERGGEGSVMRVAKDGGEVLTLADGQDIPWAIAVDATDVVWLTRLDGGVHIVAQDGGEIVTLATGQQWPLGVAILGDRVYWTDEILATVSVVDKQGGVVELFAEQQPGAYGITVVGDELWWATSAGDIVHASADGSPEVAIMGPPRAYTIAADADGVAWRANDQIEFDEGTVNTASLRGGEIVTLASGIAGLPSSVALDAETVWFPDNLAGTIVAVPRGGGTAMVVAEDQTGNGIVTDATHVYWANGAGTVVKLAK